MQSRPKFLFRLVLPLFFFALSITLGRLGEAQMNRVIQSARAQGGAFEPLPESFATARMID
jgi:hypothetical protein